MFASFAEPPSRDLPTRARRAFDALREPDADERELRRRAAGLELSVHDIAALPDPLLCNWLISRTYHRASLDVARLLGREDINWMTMAAWSSAHVGRALRGEICLLPRLAMEAAAGKQIEAVRRDVGRSLGALAYINKLIFQSIVPCFSLFVQEAAARDAAGFEGILRRHLDALSDRSGRPDILVAGFSAYHRATHAASADARAQYIFLGNACVALHEQSKLDALLAQVLDARSLCEWLHRWSPGLAGVDPLDITRRIQTRTVFWILLPDEVLWMGRPVPPRRRDRPAIPASLRSFDALDAASRRVLDEVLAHDRSRGRLDRTAASDWSKLGDRMTYILNLFRSRQMETRLFDDPLDDRSLVPRLRMQVKARSAMVRLTRVLGIQAPCPEPVQSTS
jgi:hypothetical protein